MQPSEGNPPTMGATLYGKGVLEPVGPFCFLLMVNVVLEHLSHNTCEPLYFGRQCFLHGLRLLYCYQYSNLLGEISERKWYIATIFLGFFTITSLYNCRSLLNQVTSKRDIIQFAESDFIVNSAPLTVWSGMGASCIFDASLNFSFLIVLQSQDLSRKCSAWKGLAILPFATSMCSSIELWSSFFFIIFLCLCF